MLHPAQLWSDTSQWWKCHAHGADARADQAGRACGRRDWAFPRSKNIKFAACDSQRGAVARAALREELGPAAQHVGLQAVARRHVCPEQLLHEAGSRLGVSSDGGGVRGALIRKRRRRPNAIRPRQTTCPAIMAGTHKHRKRGRLGELGLHLELLRYHYWKLDTTNRMLLSR